MKRLSTFFVHCLQRLRGAGTTSWRFVSRLYRIALGKDHNERTANFTVLMTLATTVVAVTAIIQLAEFRKQERKQLRAYVGAKPVGHLNLASGVLAAQPFVIKNFGLSPALNVKENSAVVSMAYPLTTSLQMGKPLPGAPASYLTIFPSEEFPFIAKSLAAPNDDDIRKVLTDTKSRLYVTAVVTYDDIFGYHHYTHVCALYGGGDMNITYCDRYNDTDDQ